MDKFKIIYALCVDTLCDLSICMNFYGCNSGMTPYNLTGGYHISDETPDFICTLIKEISGLSENLAATCHVT